MMHVTENTTAIHMGMFEYSDGGRVADNSVHIKYPIEWTIIKRDGANNRLLLLSKNIIEAEGFADCPILGREYETDWQSSYIRKWLNKDFFNIAFTPEEKALICPTYISPGKMNKRKTLDYLFLLAPDEVITCLKDPCAFMYYAFKDDNGCISLDAEPWPWWLRSNAENPYLVNYVTRTGAIQAQDSNADETGIRPAMWIKCNS